MKRIFLAFCCLFLTGAISAAERQYAFFSISVEEGLSHPNVTAMAYDYRGSLWIGTKNGLNRVDKQEITVFRSRMEDPFTLPDNQINRLAEGADGEIWILCNRGVARYLPGQDRFELLCPELAFCVLPLQSRVYAGLSARILVLDGEGLQTLDPFPGRNRDRSYDILCIQPLSSGELLLGTRSGGLFRYTPGQPPRLFSPATAYDLIDLYVCRDGSVCASYHGGGFCRYSSDGVLQKEYTTRNSNLPSDYIQDFVEYEGELWMATDGGGICIQEPGRDAFVCLRHRSDRDDTLPSNSITTLHVDAMGLLWAGTVKNGFFQIKKSPIRTLRGNLRGLRDNAVTSLLRDSQQTLWVGTDGGGVHRFLPQGGQFVRLPLSEGKILSMAEYDSGHLLVSMYQEGLFLLDKKTGGKKPFLLVDSPTSQKVKYSGALVRAVQTPWGTFCFLAGPTSWLWHRKDRSFHPLLMENGDPAPAGLQIACADHDGALLYKGNQIFFLDRQSERLSLLFSVGELETVTALSSDGDGTIWVGTSRALGRYLVDEGKYVPLQTRLFDDVSALEWSADGKLWICARNMLYTYLPGEDRIVSWGESDGFRPNSIKMLYQNDQDPEFLYMGGSEGLVMIDRNTPIPVPARPEFFLEHLSANGQPLSWQEEKVEIPWNRRQISVSFLVKDGDPFLKKIFHYTLKGTRNWSMSGDEPRVTLSALEAGDYELWVSCLTKSGAFSAPALLLSFTVLPPWYQTSWFLSACTALLLLVLFFLLRGIRHSEASANKNSMALFLEEMLQEGELPDNNSAEAAFRTQLDRLLRENLSNPELDIKFLTDHLFMSRSALYAKVKEVTGMGVKDYINRVRIERSVELLLHTDKNINEIAYEVGYTYPRYFSTSFKFFKGVTPTRFKKENRV